MVTRKDNNIFRIVIIDKAHILIDSVCCSLIPVRTGIALERRKDISTRIISVEVPRVTVADVSIQSQRLVLSKYTYDLYT